MLTLTHPVQLVPERGSCRKYFMKMIHPSPLVEDPYALRFANDIDLMGGSNGEFQTSPTDLLVSWCFEPSQPQRTTSGLNTNFTLSPNYSFYKSSHHKSCCCFFIAYLYSATREPASSRVTYFILRAYIGTSVSHSQRRKKSEEVFQKKNAGEWI